MKNKIKELPLNNEDAGLFVLPGTYTPQEESLK